jgi:hypothetical protein
MENLLQFQEDLAKEYEYYNLPFMLSKEIQQKYLDNLPLWCNMNGNSDCNLYSLHGTLVAKGYERIVIGDYGAFIEIDESQIVKDNIVLKKGQEYRINDKKYSKKVKYIWMTAKDKSDLKIYFQKRTVSYADYRKGMYYVSPYEVKVLPRGA